MARKVVVAGSISLDRNSLNGRCQRKLGGVATYGSFCFARHGVAPFVVSRVAAADARYLEAFRRAGVELCTAHSASTTTFENHSSGDARWQRLTRVADPIERGDLEPVLGGARLILLGPLHDTDIAPGAIEVAGGAPALVAVDLQGLTRGVESGVVRPRVSALLEPVLEASQIAKLSAEEARTVESTRGSSVRALVADFGLEELLITCGGRGGRLLLAGGRELDYAAVPANVVDPVGAGDVFFATYLYHSRLAGMERRRALERAARAAADQVAGRHLAVELELADR